MGLWKSRNERKRMAFDLECWNLRRRGYSLEYVSSRTGATVTEVVSAIRRVECGRYGDVRIFEEERS